MAAARQPKRLFQDRVAAKRVMRETRERDYQRAREAAARVIKRLAEEGERAPPWDFNNYRGPRDGRKYPKHWHQEIWNEQLGRCHYCECIMHPMTIDHVMPLSRGGKNVRSNVVGACGPCNHAKADKLPSAFRRRKCRDMAR